MVIRSNKVLTVLGTCNTCGAEYVGLPHQKYCSPKCRPSYNSTYAYGQWSILHRDGFTCIYCGATSETTKLHVDHVIPVDEGGKDIALNLATACVACNLAKGSNRLSDKAEFYILARVGKNNMKSGIDPDSPIKLSGGR